MTGSRVHRPYRGEAGTASAAQQAEPGARDESKVSWCEPTGAAQTCGNDAIV